MSKKSRSERRVLITGSGAGIGARTAHVLAEHGWRIAVFDIDGCAAVQVARSLGTTQGIAFQGDVTDPEAIERVLNAIMDTWGGIDDLVNNVGIYDHGPLLELSLLQWKHVLEANLIAPIAVSCAAARRMKAGGSIVNVSSVLGQVSAPGRGPYCVSKAALISLTKIQAIEWAARNIRVNAIAPGYITSRETDKLAQSGSIDHAAICRRTPLGRFGTEEEVARGIYFLLDPDQSSYVTGHVLEVNGGWTAYGFV
ncbi:MAG: short-chain dehydrogenase [Acidobacteria bacterium]|nr:MAG: short-chain dehydrogenase [Acidobacteriota bacterium]